MIFTCKECKYPCVISMDEKTVHEMLPLYCPIHGGYYKKVRWIKTDNRTVDGKEYVAPSNITKSFKKKIPIIKTIAETISVKIIE